MRSFVAAVVVLLPACTHHHHHYPSQKTTSGAPRSEGSECLPSASVPDSSNGRTLDDGDIPHAHRHVAVDGKADHSEATLKPVVVAHSDLKEYSLDGARLIGLATKSMGARTFEVWRSSVEPGKTTPRHEHSSEEVFVVLRGSGEVIVGEMTVPFQAPATVIAPAGVPHRLRNTGKEATDHFVIVAIGSEIRNEAGEVMQLPWRH